MKELMLLVFLLLIVNTFLPAQSPAAQEYHLLVGTYSTNEQINGIHVYRFNATTGEFNQAQPVTELRNASFLTVSHDRKNVYSISDGKLNAFAFDPVTAKLSYLNSVPAEGPAYVAVDKKKQAVFCGNYGGGNVMAVRLHADGSLAADQVQLIQHDGKSINTARQEKSHPHAAVLSLDDRYLMVPDLGNDRVYQYRVNTASRELISPAKMPYLSVTPGSGPRHLAYHPNRKFAYMVLELSGEVLALDIRNESMVAIQTISLVDQDFKGRLSGADIHVSPDGKFLYASNRGDANEIAIFSIGKNGQLKRIHRQSVLGKMPRNFAIDPSGNFLLVGNQNSDEIVIFRRDQKSGLLTPTGKTIAVAKPVCLKFVGVEK